MKSIAECMNELFVSMGVDAGKLARIHDNNTRYIRAVNGIWKDAEARQLILDHTNAFYVRPCNQPRRGIPFGEEYAICEVCVDDPLVRSEIDTHRELLAFALRSDGLAFEELRIISAKGSMRQRHPFRKEGNCTL